MYVKYKYTVRYKRAYMYRNYGSAEFYLKLVWRRSSVASTILPPPSIETMTKKNWKVIYELTLF